jgi:hypothetical protein
MVNFNVTRSARASDGTFTTSTIKGSVQQGGGNVAGVPGTWAKYAHSFFTSAVIKEGDRVTDAFLNLYDVHHCPPYVEGDNFEHYICELVKISAYTLQTLTLGGTADTITGHYPATYTNSTIYGNLSPKGVAAINTGVGYYGKYDYVFVTASAVLEGNRILDAGSVTYEVKQVQSYPSSRSDFVFNWTVCGCIKVDFAVEPATSGTWHLDSQAVKTDPRNRIKVTIDTYLTANNIEKDNGSTDASTLTCFDGIPYPITRLFLTKAHDAVAVISRGTSTVLYTDWVFGHKPYGFEEEVKIELYAVNKVGITASNLLEQFEQEIRRIFTVYDPYANVRDLEAIAPSMIDLGYGFLYHTAITIKYKRANDDYTPTYPTITWGPSTSATGTYTFPNVTKFGYVDPDTGDIRMLPPGRMGEIVQILGSEDFEVVLVSDLSLEPAAKTWKRAQASTKTDDVAWEVFNEIKFKGKTDATMIYQTFNYGGGSTVPVRVTSVAVDGETLTVHLKRYSSVNQSGGTYSAYYGN